MAQGVSQSWTALYTALGTLFPGPGQLVCQGEPGEYQPDLIVAMMALRAPVTQPTAGTTRSRDKRIEINLAISTFVHGGPEAQAPAVQAAWDASDAIETYLRTGNNATLGGACYNAFLDSGDMTPLTAWETVEGFDDPVPAGRIAALEAVVKVWIRI